MRSENNDMSTLTLSLSALHFSHKPKLAYLAMEINDLQHM